MKFSTPKLLIAAAVLLSVGGCATTTKVAVEQPGDKQFTCEQLKEQFSKLDSINQEADGNKGVTATNVAAVLFFWPAVAATYMDADKAEKLVAQRREHLMRIYNSKSCS